MKMLKGKLNNKGFTLVEMLAVLFILGVLTALMAMIMPVAAKTFFNVVDSANSQVLLSTTITELRDELGTATNITVSLDRKKITYLSANTGNMSTISSKAENGNVKEGIYIEGGTEGTAEADNNMLVTRAAATYKLTIVCDSFAYDESTGIITINNLDVHNADKTLTLASRKVLNIRTGKG